MSNVSVKSGQMAEQLAVQYLQDQGLKLIQQNFHSRFGEIDAIMRDGDSVVFVEVKKRVAGIDAALESITWAKQQKLVRAAKYYLTKLNRDVACRFDAVAIDKHNDCQWLKNIIML
jgi:putative endonuclease